MTYRTIAVHVNASRHTPGRVRVACRIAKATQAHLVGVAGTGVPEALYLGGLAGEGGVGINAYLDLMKENAGTALAAFAQAAGHAGVASVEQRIAPQESGVALCAQARYSDLVVVGQSDPDEAVPGERGDIAEVVLTQGGKPVLVVPYAGSFETFEAFDQRALIAWDASIEAARAVSGALPLLRQARQVQVACFAAPSTETQEPEPGAALVLYLARHGVNAELFRQHVEGGAHIGESILTHAAEFGAGLVVMGGYGHSRIRESLLGGVTRTMLQTMTVPVLMAH